MKILKRKGNLPKYSNIQSKTHKNIKTIHKVHICNNTGFKSITKCKKGKKNKTIKRKLNSDEIILILNKKFIPGLFKNCK